MAAIVRLEGKPGFHFLDTGNVCWCGSVHMSMRERRDVVESFRVFDPEWTPETSDAETRRARDNVAETLGEGF